MPCKIVRSPLTRIHYPFSGRHHLWLGGSRESCRPGTSNQYPAGTLSCRSLVASSFTKKWQNGYCWRGWGLSVLVGTGVLRSINPIEPLRLESRNREHLEADDIAVKYLPPVVPYTINQANDALRWEEHSEMCGMGGGVLRFDSVRLPSNIPCEDEILSASGHEDDEIRWLMWGVFDGHAGWETAAALHDYLVRYVVRELVSRSASGRVSDVEGSTIDRALKEAFLSLDRDIMDLAAKAVSRGSSLSEGLAQVGTAYAGSCALLAYYHSDSQHLKVACAGDSRAVLGRRNGSGGWDVVALSADQTGDNEDEVFRLTKEHPDEPNMIKAGRILGMAVTRAFGDSRWKWARELQERAHKRFYGPKVIEPFLTPPYLTAEPVVTTTRIEPDKGDFMIMASDGLWDNLSGEQAVNLIGRWLEKHDPSKAIQPPDLATPPATLPGRHLSIRQNGDSNKAYAKEPVADERHFVVADDNAATHLARNALGGGNEDRLCGMLTASSSYSRNVRDDISIQVIFFGNEDPYSINNFSDDSMQRL